MKKIWEFFENMNEYVYVSDVETYTLIYMNKKAREAYDFYFDPDLPSEKCYKILQNSSTPCNTCNNSAIKPGCFKEWNCYNPIIDRHLMIKDTIVEEEGRLYKVEIAISMETQERQNKILRSYQSLEKYVKEGFRVALQESNLDKSIEIALEYLGKALNGERTYIFEKNKKGGDDNTYEWVANGVMPEIDNLQDLPPEICANWYRQFSEDKNIVIEDLEDIRENDPLQYDNLKRQNIHSLVVVPLYDDGKAIGFYGVDNPPEKSLDYATNMLQIMGHFIVSSLKRRNLVNQLQYMSYHDQLTKIGNRHAMNDYIARLQENESIGVVYCDITGLKRVNDEQGHEAGDRLIISACESLKKAFSDYGMFRIGGDELLVLCPDIEECTLRERVELLKEVLVENAVAMAMGFVWKKDSSGSIDVLVSEAETLMYEDKDLYYKDTGIKRIR